MASNFSPDGGNLPNSPRLKGPPLRLFPRLWFRKKEAPKRNLRSQGPKLYQESGICQKGPCGKLCEMGMKGQQKRRGSFNWSLAQTQLGANPGPQMGTSPPIKSGASFGNSPGKCLCLQKKTSRKARNPGK